MIVTIPRIELASEIFFISINLITHIEFCLDITITPNALPDGEDDYPTIEADFNSLEVPMQKSLSSDSGISGTPRQFGCSSFCYNQGVCILSGQSISCRCSPGFIGTRCQVSRKNRKFLEGIPMKIIVL